MAAGGVAAFLASGVGALLAGAKLTTIILYGAFPLLTVLWVVTFPERYLEAHGASLDPTDQINFLRVQVVNDTPRTVDEDACWYADCRSTGDHPYYGGARLAPGASSVEEVLHDDETDAFLIRTPAGTRLGCLTIHPNAVYRELRDKQTLVPLRVSSVQPCLRTK
jgi:hypothetical protein